MPSKEHIYIYYWKNSDEVAERIRATSRRQADHKLGLKRGRAWTDEALDTGLLYMGKAVEPRPAAEPKPEPALRQTELDFDSVEEAINQLIKNWDDKTGKPMLKAWQKALNGLVPLSKEVMESTKARQLYHGTSIDRHETV